MQGLIKKYEFLLYELTVFPKTKRLRPEVEKAELELFWKGELAIEDSEEEKEDPKVCSFPDL
jgi:hypothetical protein